MFNVVKHATTSLVNKQFLKCYEEK